MYEWSVQWSLSFNPTNCVHIEVGKDIISFTLELNSTPIPLANSVRYLGVFIENNFKWHKHISKVPKKNNKEPELNKKSF